MTAEVTLTVLYMSENSGLSPTPPLSNISLTGNNTISYTEVHVDASNNTVFTLEHTTKLGVQL
jgi:hypothetical protein